MYDSLPERLGSARAGCTEQAPSGRADDSEFCSAAIPSAADSEIFPYAGARAAKPDAVVHSRDFGRCITRRSDTVADEVLYVHYAGTSCLWGWSLQCLQEDFLHNRSEDELRLETQHRVCVATDHPCVVNPEKRYNKTQQSSCRVVPGITN